MTNTETYTIIVGIAGLYVGLLIGMCMSKLNDIKTDRKMRGHYRDLTEDDKANVIFMLDDISEQYEKLTALIPVSQLKQSKNHICKLVYELNRLFTE